MLTCMRLSGGEEFKKSHWNSLVYKMQSLKKQADFTIINITLYCFLVAELAGTEAAGSDGHPLRITNRSLFPIWDRRREKVPMASGASYNPTLPKPWQQTGTHGIGTSAASIGVAPSSHQAPAAPNQRHSACSTSQPCHAQTGRGAAPQPPMTHSCLTPSTGTRCPNQQQTPPQGIGKGRDEA